nr:hypothetical protein [Biomaibacter acetigenes]
MIIAEYAGFCYGVKRAMEMVEDLIKRVKRHILSDLLFTIHR